MPEFHRCYLFTHYVTYFCSLAVLIGFVFKLYRFVHDRLGPTAWVHSLTKQINQDVGTMRGNSLEDDSPTSPVGELIDAIVKEVEAANQSNNQGATDTNVPAEEGQAKERAWELFTG